MLDFHLTISALTQFFVQGLSLYPSLLSANTTTYKSLGQPIRSDGQAPVSWLLILVSVRWHIHSPSLTDSFS